MICLDVLPGAESGLKAATATSAYGTRDAFMEPASSRGNATARKAGADYSATKVRRRDISIQNIFKKYAASKHRMIKCFSKIWR